MQTALPNFQVKNTPKDPTSQIAKYIQTPCPENLGDARITPVARSGYHPQNPYPPMTPRHAPGMTPDFCGLPSCRRAFVIGWLLVLSYHRIRLYRYSLPGIPQSAEKEKQKQKSEAPFGRRSPGILRTHSDTVWHISAPKRAKRRQC